MFGFILACVPEEGKEMSSPELSGFCIQMFSWEFAATTYLHTEQKLIDIFIGTFCTLLNKVMFFVVFVRGLV